MAVTGKVAKAKYGAIHARHVVYETLTGPSADVTINASATGNVVISVASEVPRDVQYAGVESVSGLPADVYIAAIAFDKTNKTLTLTLYNAGAAAVTISAGSLTVKVISVA